MRIRITDTWIKYSFEYGKDITQIIFEYGGWYDDSLREYQQIDEHYDGSVMLTCCDRQINENESIPLYDVDEIDSD